MSSSALDHVGGSWTAPKVGGKSLAVGRRSPDHCIAVAGALEDALENSIAKVRVGIGSHGDKLWTGAEPRNVRSSASCVLPRSMREGAIRRIRQIREIRVPP